MIATLNKISQTNTLLGFCRKNAREKPEDLRYLADHHPGAPITLQPEKCDRKLGPRCAGSTPFACHPFLSSCPGSRTRGRRHNFDLRATPNRLSKAHEVPKNITTRSHKNHY